MKSPLIALTSLLVLLIAGAIAVLLADLIVKSYSFGLLGNIVVGIVGALSQDFCIPCSGSV
jgi:uncharacterized membrane protein YeaQ/YmgE (transglycosylase-associated protein family)